MIQKNKAALIILTGLMITVFCFIGISDGGEMKPNEEVNMVTEGKLVKVKYVLTVDGNVVDSTKEGEPFQFTAGSNQVILGFEEAIMGMKTGEKKSFQVGPEKGYGQENPKGFQKVPREKLPPDVKPEVGMTLHATMPDGQAIPARIMEVNEDIIVLNFNHPLAGKTLNFEVEVIGIN
jgi:FKBP-type peptidyl-prolyl cis-trans isomerase 2